MAKRRKFADQFKQNVALEALRCDKTIQEIAARHQLPPKQAVHAFTIKPGQSELVVQTMARDAFLSANDLLWTPSE